MDIHPIRTPEDHKAALKEVSAYFEDEPEIGTPDGDRFEILLTLIDAYEAKNHPIASPDPIEAIKFRMEQQGLTAGDLVGVIGQRNRVHEVLTHKRSLTLQMIRNLVPLGIPAEVLIQPSGPGVAAR